MAKIPACALHSLTVRNLSKFVPIQPGVLEYGQIHWRSGFSVSVQVDKFGSLISYRWRQFDVVNNTTEHVEWDWLAVGFGVRHYFRCPKCNKRCGKIFLRFGRWTCKRCAGVCADSENDNPFFRRIGKLEKLKRKLGIKAGQAIVKPVGMHWKTYKLLIAQVLRIYRQCTIEGDLFTECIRKKIE